MRSSCRSLEVIGVYRGRIPAMLKTEPCAAYRQFPSGLTGVGVMASFLSLPHFHFRIAIRVFFSFIFFFILFHFLNIANEPPVAAFLSCAGGPEPLRRGV